MTPYNKSAINSYVKNNTIGLSGKQLTEKIVKSILYYINSAIIEFEKENKNNVNSFKSLNSANLLLIDMVENLNTEIQKEEFQSVLKILATVEYDVIEAQHGKYEGLLISKKGLETILSVVQN